ncbi:MAG: methylenetetrahydrofolate reductase [NAD(P)H] [Candidatus Omnitrophica bacterium]|nr:methylenetetrahydrofolate reductase [NAD(P)H] [Candidatus Omnitrophota bacterium]
MRISEILKANPQGVSFEFFPPKTEKAQEALRATYAVLKKYKPLYVSMTYGAGGTTQNTTREGVDILVQAKDAEVMPHLTCIGAKRAGIAALLQQYHDRGIENIMALRGDPPRDGRPCDLSGKDFCYASDLVAFIRSQNSFCTGIAVYPEGHIESASIEQDAEITRKKIDAGAEFAVTQMFFDNRYYFRMQERFRAAGITIPVLPGILPLTDVAKVKQFAAIARTTIPRHIETAMSRFADSPEDMEKLGIEFTIAQCRELREAGIGRLHFFTLNRPSVMETILKAL